MPAEYKDYYKTLGVSKTADGPAIKKAFRKLARIHHPDVAKDKSTAEERFKDINEAYEVLSSPEKRKQYDHLGANWDQPSSRAPYRSNQGSHSPSSEFQFEGTGFSDFFEQYFSGNSGRPSSQFPRNMGPRSKTAVRGQDIEGDLMVTLEEAYQGSTRTISLTTTNPTSGTSSTDEIQVRIPPGIGEGQRLRVPSQGGTGVNGGADGDLYLRIRIAADPDFSVTGHDLFRELYLTPWEATLGTTLPLNLPGNRTVQLKIPAGTSSGTQLRLAGYGLPRKDKPGDLFVEIEIHSPPTVSAEEATLWENIRESSSFNPRVHP